MGGPEEKRRRHLILPALVSVAGPKPDVAAAVNLATTLSVGEVPASGGTRPSLIATEEAFATPEYLQAYLRLAAQSDAVGLRYPAMQLSRLEMEERLTNIELRIAEMDAHGVDMHLLRARSHRGAPDPSGHPGRAAAHRQGQKPVVRSEYIGSIRAESRRRLRIAIDKALTPGDVERLSARYEAENVNAEVFLLAKEDPKADVATCEKRRAVRAAMVFVESYRELPRLAWPREVLDAVLDMEQSMLIWRQRHARMVERIIGRRTGTGGSAGVGYPDQTALRYRVFSDLWTVRSLLLRKSSVPELEHGAEYGFRVEDRS